VLLTGIVMGALVAATTLLTGRRSH
jgi:hypothetical protein